MAAVLRLVKFCNRDTVACLKWLVLEALAGRVTGIALMYRTVDGRDLSMFTDAYRAHPADAVNATMRLSWKLTQVQDAVGGPP